MVSVPKFETWSCSSAFFCCAAGKQTRFDGELRQFGPVLQSQFGHQPRAIGLDGFHTEIEPIGNRLVGVSLRDLEEHFAFAFTEGGEQICLFGG